MTVDREFVRETDDTIRKLTVDLVELEESVDRETLDEAFRRSHALKGNLGMVGLEGARDLAHALEDVLDAIRAGDRPADEAAVDAALEAADEIGRAVERAHRGETTPELDPLTERLRSLAEPADTGDLPRSAAADVDGQDGDDDDGSTDDDADVADAGVADTGFVFETAGETVDDPEDERSAAGGGEPELDGEARAALDAASEFDDLDDLVAEMDDAEAFADLEGGGAFEDVLADEPDGGGDEPAADTGDSTDGEPAGPPDDEDGGGSIEGVPGEGADDVGADRAGEDTAAVDDTEEGTPSPGGAFSEFQEIRADVEPDDDLAELQRDIEETSFGEFDDEDDLTIDELLMTGDGETTSDGAPAGDESDATAPATDAPAGESGTAAEADATPPEPEPAADAPDTGGQEPGPTSAEPEPAIREVTDVEPSDAEPAVSEPSDAASPSAPAPDPPVEPTGADASECGRSEPAASEPSPDREPAIREVTEPTDGEDPRSDQSATADEGSEHAPAVGATASTDEPPPSAETSGEPSGGEPSGPSAEASTSASADPAESATAGGAGPDRTPPEDEDGLGPEVEELLSEVDLSDGDDPGSFETGSTGLESRAGFVGVARDDAASDFEARFADLFTAGTETGRTDARTVATIPEGNLDPTASGSGDDGPELPARQRTTGPASLAVDPGVGDELIRQVRDLAAAGRRLAAVADRTDPAVRDALSALQSATGDVRRTALEVRLMPLSTVTDGFGRVVRDVARAADVEADFEAHGTDVRLDRDVLDRIGDPLVHLVRNAVDHGIEAPEEREAAGKPRAGTVELRARREGDRATIEVRDDGSGLDPAAIRETAVDEGLVTADEAASLSRSETFDLLFEPGFSTTDEVTATSGRGVGMDAVERAVTELNGTVEVESEPGDGTTVRLSVPVTVAVAEVVFLAVGDEQYALPTADVEAVQYATEAPSEDEAGRVRIGDGSHPLVRLGEALDARHDGSDRVVVRVDPDVRDVALGVDDVGEKREVVVTPYEDVLGGTAGLGGATLLEDETVVNVIDVETL